jgi:bifunctional non-homologous end joining protein LigD
MTHAPHVPPAHDRRRVDAGHPHTVAAADAPRPRSADAGGGGRLVGGRTLVDLGPMEPDRRMRAPLSSHSYLYELKLAGTRVRALVDHGSVELLDSDCRDCRGAFPNITASLKLLRGGPHVLDGVCTAQIPGSLPNCTLCVFDLLYQDGQDITHLPLLDRKQALFDLVGPELPSVIYMGHFEDCGRGLWHAVTQLHLDGVMARRKDSEYRVWHRSGDWRVIDRDRQGPDFGGS